MSITAADFKTRFPEFSTVTDARVDTMIDRAELQVNEGVWGTLYDEGLYYLSAHFLFRAEAASGGGASGSGPVASKSVGDVSISFSNPTAATSVESLYQSTPYGAEFWALAMIVGTQLGVVGWTDA